MATAYASFLTFAASFANHLDFQSLAGRGHSSRLIAGTMSTDIVLIVTVTAGDVLFGLAWFTEETRKGVLEPNYSILKLLPAVRQTQNTGIVTIMIALTWHKQWRRQT